MQFYFIYWRIVEVSVLFISYFNRKYRSQCGLFVAHTLHTTLLTFFLFRPITWIFKNSATQRLV